MLGRKTYTQEEFDQAKKAIDQQLRAYNGLAKAVNGAASVGGALDAFEPLFFNNLTLALDRFFVHRLRMVAGKDGNPLNEVALLADSLITEQGLLRTGNVKYVPEQSVLGLEPGEEIRLTRDQFERLSKAFFGELQARFL
jgi:hypothetical protein